ncbi:glycosyltransferase-like domain-containing protein 1 isoform X7 [Dermacentor silvarum]|uniref:glycosyltransferase-like domain-containing protein 1 isoform X7 n=1 Tax=Dermacentor silvarum TaxID=543639 RepID=UPI002100DB35|nr:glycosyltransferase-like domain-containing protein 1 isoform X7 [Dermacentor silvarum]
MAVLLLEPFYGGSHRQLMDLLSVELGPQGCRLVTLPANKWHWRARTAALWLAERIEPSNGYRVLMASGTLNLAELLGLRPDLSPLRKLLYMHENQLAYPVQKEQQRDFQYGYNQVASCLVADVVLFNSCFNRDSFLSAVEPFLNRVPGAGHLGPLRYRLEAKAQVLPFPVDVPLAPALCRDPAAPLHIVWPHRWEHDKGPEEFVQALLELHRLGLRFQVSFLGQQFDQLPRWKQACLAATHCAQIGLSTRRSILHAASTTLGGSWSSGYTASAYNPRLPERWPPSWSSSCAAGSQPFHLGVTAAMLSGTAAAAA